MKLRRSAGLVVLLVAVLCPLALDTSSAAAAAPPLSGEIPTGISTGSNDVKSIATLSDGTVVVVGAHKIEGLIDVYEFLLHPDGSLITQQPFQLNQQRVSRSVNPTVVALPGAQYAVVWDSFIDPPDPHSPGRLLARRFDHLGRPLDDEIAISGQNRGTPLGSVEAVALADGGVAVAWTDTFNRGRLQVLNADLSPRHAPVTTYGRHLLSFPDGRFGAFTGPQLRFYNASGDPAGGTVLPGDTFVVTKLIALRDGSMVGVGAAYSNPESPPRLEIEHVDPRGHLIGQPSTITPPGVSAGSERIALLSGGGFVVTWSAGSGGLAQTFSADAHPVGDQRVISSEPPTATTPPVVAPSSHDGFAVVWTARSYEGVVRLFPGDPTAAHQRGVDVAYRLLLGRAPDQAGSSYWTSQLDAGLPFGSFAAVLARSAEGRARVIAADYRAAFGRAPDPGGLAYWTDQLTRTGRPDVIEAALFATPEALNHAGLTARAYVAALYPAYLGRGGDAGGIVFWTDVLENAGNTPAAREALARTFNASAENLSAAVTGRTRDACGHPPVSLAQAGTLADAYARSARDPLLLTARALALVCPPDS